MWLKWFPWRFIVSRVSKTRGFIDPISVLNAVHRFAQPSEVAQPTELLRSGVIMHARGLMNTQAIQHNLDWIWPYWVECQFNPDDIAFIPRAFSITHVNLTHRNWTAVGLPGLTEMPLVDPRGLVTPFFNSWSLDFWIIPQLSAPLLPSKSPHVFQSLDLENNLSVTTRINQDSLTLKSNVTVVPESKGAEIRIQISAESAKEAELVLSIRPYNPEGVSFIHKIETNSKKSILKVEDAQEVFVNPAADKVSFSTYRRGDVFHCLNKDNEATEVCCNVGMATAALSFKLTPDKTKEIVVTIPLKQVPNKKLPYPSWKESLEGHCKVSLPNQRFEFLFDSALRTLLLLAPDEIYPGPYTYKRFWFRDAAFMLHALLCAGLLEQAEKVLDYFPSRQRWDGYYLSQEGEWDSNGEALWIFARYFELSGQKLKDAWVSSIERGAEWIIRKRKQRPEPMLSGLFPPGFSAEHFGPSDYYYWDNFWGIIGLRSAASIMSSINKTQAADHFTANADAFEQDLEKSISLVLETQASNAIPAGPQRRMDSAAVGNLIAGYPLQLFPADDKRLRATAEYLMQHCVHHGGFFQEMIHSGVNAYLTLHLAQVFLRQGDLRFFGLTKEIAELATATGQWPEAIHPKTKGGCMGDGQHGWAAAEWLMIIRNMFVREEGNSLILCSGIIDDLLVPGKPLSFGPTLTAYGQISVFVEHQVGAIEVSWNFSPRTSIPPIEIRLPGYQAVSVEAGIKKHRFPSDGAK